MHNRKTKASRSRTGCQTCKIRHVKCGEEKPECLQCKNSGRKCDGYNTSSQDQLPTKVVHRQSRPAWTMVSPDHRLILRPGTREERQYVELFCSQTSQALSGFFSPQLWNFQLPRLSQSEPTIRHAIAALGAAHERSILNPSAENAVVTEQFILQQYNKSIQYLMEHLTAPKSQSVDLLLVTCGLFVCLEIVRGNNKQAFNHLAAGATILHRRAHFANTTPQSMDIDRELSHLFFRLNMQLSLFGRPLVPLTIGHKGTQPPSAEGKASFSSIEEARHCLDGLMNKALRFVRLSLQNPTPSDATRIQQRQKQQDIKEEFDAWAMALNKMMARRGNSKTLDKRGPLTLRLHHQVSLIWLQACFATDQMGFDNFRSNFETIVRLAEEVVRLGPDQEKPSPANGFSLESGITPPLWFTAVKCRDPIIRRKAIQILSHYRKREGMWDMGLFFKVAELVLESEEAELSSLPIEKRVPEDRQRIYDPILPEEIVASPCQVILLSRPDGVDGGWHTRTVYISWTS
ncbi:C6 zinc finger domain protein [Aspergillus pseudotamarii]|uniref:C6 zinc finger domain protein n=1 Tax=Aspergillus pseudotamarii TaxID=132259 RepID=A0A5N6STU3_ASPPS|nr:C6 zinc finger domain protein [Aspergillus pseudotamarii]KAE8137201.1 C6 zinc finger domain protein [Aspergillus pseudotamarii]